jgi:hypothetical protein
MKTPDQEVDELIGAFNAISPTAKSRFVRKFITGLVTPLRGDKLEARYRFLIECMLDALNEVGEEGEALLSKMRMESLANVAKHLKDLVKEHVEDEMVMAQAMAQAVVEGKRNNPNN